jgi:stage II sporulation protein D
MRRISRVLTTAALLVAVGCAPKRLPPVGTGMEAPPPAPAPAPEGLLPRLLGVGLQEDRSEFVLGATGPAELQDASGRRLAHVDENAQVVCRRQGGRVAWSAAGRSGKASAVRLAPADPSLRVTWGDEHYRGDFLVILTPGSTTGLTLVNDVELEAYLRGVVPWEIGRLGREGMAALEAQAVAARTYTVSHRGARRDRGFDVWADVMDQVYRGARDEDPLCNEAIENTAGLVLRHGGREIEAYYSACCGGVSHPDGPPGGEAWCRDSRHFHWREVWSRPELEAIIARTLPEYLDYAATGGRAPWAGVPFIGRGRDSDPRRPGRLRGLEISGRTTSGRVSELLLTTDAGVYRVRGDRVRWVLTPPSGKPAILRSALFDLELEWVDDALRTIAVRGRGFGHGIGMCQTGAIAMAKAGWSAAAILEHYYPGARLEAADGTPR